MMAAAVTRVLEALHTVGIHFDSVLTAFAMLTIAQMDFRAPLRFSY